MEQKINKVQIYLDENTSDKIKEMAKSRSMSVSKYAARVLEMHTESALKNEIFQAKTQSMLAQILACVYDQELINSNSGEIKNLVKIIESRVTEKVENEFSDS